MRASCLYYRGRILLVAAACCLDARAQHLVYSTYLGGANSDVVRAMAVDREGSVYVTGETLSGDFPVTPGVLQSRHAGTPASSFLIPELPKTDVFVTKIAPDGSRIVWSTYLGGSRRDVGTAIALDALGNVYVAGTTNSADFPTTAGAWQRSAPAAGNLPVEHGFVAKLNPSGTALIYSTLLAGSLIHRIAGLAVDSAGNAFVTGSTISPDFPTTPGAWQRTGTPLAFPSDVWFSAFVTKINPAGSGLAYSTYLTGGRGAAAAGIALDGGGNAVVVGSTQSPDFPITPGAYQDAPAGPVQAFATKVHFSGSALIWSTFLGREKADATAVAVNANGSVFIAGAGDSPLAPAFVMRLNGGGEYRYANVLGGRRGASPSAIAADADGNAYVAGQTSSPDLPVTAGAVTGSFATAPCWSATSTPFQSTVIVLNCGDAFVAKYGPEGELLFSTYFAGNDADGALAVAVDGSGGFYIGGSTGSQNLPATGFAQHGRGGGCTFSGFPSFSGSPPSISSHTCEDGFVAKFSTVAAEVPALQVLNGASHLPGAIAPGEVVMLQVDSTLVTRGDPVIAFDGVTTPALRDSNGGLFATVPAAVEGRQRVDVEVRQTLLFPGGPHYTVSTTVDVTAVTPGVFVAGGTGQGEAAAGAAFSVVGVWVTGVDSNPSVYVGGSAAGVVFVGPAPGLPAGVTQINFWVPVLPAGPQPLFVTSGKVVTSQAGVYVTVRR